MTLEIRINGVLITNRVEQTGGTGGVAGFPGSAWYGETMTAGLQFDDPLGDFEIDGWQVLTVDETACSKPRIFTGWIAGTNWHRGPYRSGAGRVIDCDIVDQNALFGFEVFRSSAASLYPAQTDLQRIEQARASHAMAATPIVDNGRVSATNPLNLTAVNFVAQVPGELFASTAGQCGKNFYAYWDDTEDELSLHYAPLGEGPAAGWGVSNVMADVDDDTVFYPFIDGNLNRSPAEVFTGVLLGYAGGRWVYVRDEDLIGPTPLSPVNFLRDLVYQTDRIGLTSTAQSVAQSTLLAKADEQKTVTFTARVPAAKVNLTREGDIIPIRFTHLRGFETETEVAIVRRNVVPSPGRRDMYDITFECAGFATARGPGGGTGGETPSQPGDGPSIANMYGKSDAGGTPNTLIWGSGTPEVGAAFTPTAGNILIHVHADRDGADIDYVPTSVPGGDTWTILEGIPGGGLFTDSIVWAMVVSDGTETGIVVDGTTGGGVWIVYEIADGDSTTIGTASDTDTGTLVEAALAATAGRAALIFQADAASGDSIVSHSPGSGWTEDYQDTPSSDFHPHFSSIHKSTTSTSATETPSTTLSDSRTWKAVSLIIYGSGVDTPPPPHVEVPPREPGGDVDGSNQDFTTDPFDPLGRLVFLHDGIDQTPHVTTFDGPAGTFSLDYAPSAGSELRIGTQTP